MVRAVEQLDDVARILALAALLVVILPWLLSQSRRSVSLRSYLAAIDWRVLLVYLDLSFVAGDLGWWVMWHVTFGGGQLGGPSNEMVVISGFAACAIAFAAVLLPFYRLVAALLAFSGLTVAIVAFAITLGPEAELGRQWDELAGIGLAVAGMILVARSAHL